METPAPSPAARSGAPPSLTRRLQLLGVALPSRSRRLREKPIEVESSMRARDGSEDRLRPRGQRAGPAPLRDIHRRPRCPGGRLNQLGDGYPNPAERGYRPEVGGPAGARLRGPRGGHSVPAVGRGLRRSVRQPPRLVPGALTLASYRPARPAEHAPPGYPARPAAAGPGRRSMPSLSPSRARGTQPLAGLADRRGRRATP